MSLPVKPPGVKPPITIKKPNAKGAIKSLLKKYSTIILYTLCFALCYLGVIYAYGGDNYSVMSYLWLQIIVLILGIIHIIVGGRFFPWASQYDSSKMILLTIVLSGFGAGLVLLSKHWDWLPALLLPYANAWMIFLAPLLFMITYTYLNRIPQKVFKSWKYPYGKEIPIVEVINPIKVKFYVAKQRSDDEYTEFALNVPKNYKVGEFMHYFIHRYNYDKNPQAPIYISPDNSGDHLYSWLFRSKPGSMKNSEVLDAELTFDQASIKENDAIIVERYQEASQSSKNIDESKLTKLGMDIDIQENIQSQQNNIEHG